MKKKILVGLLVATGVAVLTGGVYATWLMTPPGMPTTAEEAAEMLTSARFQRLPIERKEAYIARMRELISEMDDEQRRAFFEANRDNDELREVTREVFQEVVMNRAREYAAADPNVRLAMLDETIDEMLAAGQGFRRGGFGFAGRGAGGPGGQGQRGPGGNDGQPQTANAEDAQGENAEGTQDDQQQDQAQQEQRRPPREPLTEEERAERQQQREERRQERVEERQVEEATGNPQDGPLMQEYRQALRERMRERGIDMGRGRGGGQRGGGRGR